MTDIALRWNAQRARADFDLVRGTTTRRVGQAATFSGVGSIYTPPNALVDATIRGAAQFDLRAKVALADWTPDGDVSVLDQCIEAANSVFFFSVLVGGFLAVGLSEDGGVPVGPSVCISTAPVPADDGMLIWIRASVDTSDVVRFYTSPDGVSWTVLGAPVAVSNGANLLEDNPDIQIGQGDGGGQLVGKVYHAEIRNALDAGAVVLSFDAEDGAPGDTTVHSSGPGDEDWTLIGEGVAITAAGLEVVDTPAIGVETDEGLETAVIISLFTDARADEGEELPDGGDDRRGWFGDAVPVKDGDKIGSKLWLLSRSKLTPDVLARAQQYAQEALDWLVEDQVAESVAVTATSPAPGQILWKIDITRPRQRPVTYQYASAWEAQAERAGG